MINSVIKSILEANNPFIVLAILVVVALFIFKEISALSSQARLKRVETNHLSHVLEALQRIELSINESNRESRESFDKMSIVLTQLLERSNNKRR